MAKRTTPDDFDEEVTTGELRRAVKRLHTGDEARARRQPSAALFKGAPVRSRLCAALTRLRAPQPHLNAEEEAARAAAWTQRLAANPWAAPAAEPLAGAPPPGGAPGSLEKAARWKARGLDSQRSQHETPESPSRPPLASEDSEGEDGGAGGGEYADVNSLLRSLHFERLLRLQARSPQLAAAAPSAALRARTDTAAAAEHAAAGGA